MDEYKFSICLIKEDDSGISNSMYNFLTFMQSEIGQLPERNIQHDFAYQKCLNSLSILSKGKW